MFCAPQSQLWSFNTPQWDRTMTPHPYTEDQLVEQPAIGLFATLGWQTICSLEETFGAGGTLGRETKGEVVLVERLRAALVKLNPTLPAEAVNTAIDELTRDRSAMSLEAANRGSTDCSRKGLPSRSPPASPSPPAPLPRARG